MASSRNMKVSSRIWERCDDCSQWDEDCTCGEWEEPDGSSEGSEPWLCLHEEYSTFETSRWTPCDCDRCRAGLPTARDLLEDRCPWLKSYNNRQHDAPENKLILLLGTARPGELPRIEFEREYHTFSGREDYWVRPLSPMEQLAASLDPDIWLNRARAIYIEIADMRENLHGCDWCCGGGDETMSALRAEIGNILQAVGAL